MTQRTSKQKKGTENDVGILALAVLALGGIIGFLIVTAEPIPSGGPTAPRDPVHAAASPAQGREEHVALCRDGKDNDEDGKTDYPQDEGCDSPTDDTEGYACNDGVDNDSDGRIDGKDLECSSEADNTEDALESCKDGHDNDYDQKVDYPEDEGCDDANDPTEGYACNDGVDNDDDGKVDDKDPDCSSDADNTEDVVDTCTDDRDNDGDGLTDFPADDGCDSTTDPRED